jgi:hypothetical protein
MARIPRHEIIAEDEVGTYHCVQRCVRRAFLCGKDAVTGKNYDHRKEWIRRRLEFLAANFAIDILGYAALSNHLHLVLRNRPDLVAAWSDPLRQRRLDRCPTSRLLCCPQFTSLIPVSIAISWRLEHASEIMWVALCPLRSFEPRANP